MLSSVVFFLLSLNVFVNGLMFIGLNFSQQLLAHLPSSETCFLNCSSLVRLTSTCLGIKYFNPTVSFFLSGKRICAEIGFASSNLTLSTIESNLEILHDASAELVK